MSKRCILYQMMGREVLSALYALLRIITVRWVENWRKLLSESLSLVPSLYNKSKS